MRLYFKRFVSSPALTVSLIAAAFLLFGILLSAAGNNASSILKIFVLGGWGSKTALSESLVKATSILLCALAVALPGRLGLINIGGEGQFLMGALGATWCALTWAFLPRVLLLPLMAFSAVALAALWGLLPGALRAFTRSSETVISLLLNYVAELLLLHLIHGPWKDPKALGWAQTAAFGESARLYHFPGTRIHILLICGLAFAISLVVASRYTTWGLAAKVVYASPEAARYAGIPYRVFFVVTFLLGGGIAGLAGFGEVAGVQGRLREGISLGYGYAGFLVAWLCRNRFSWIPVASLLLGGLLAAGDVLQINAGLPFATVNILQGLLFLAVLTDGALEGRIFKYATLGECSKR